MKITSSNKAKQYYRVKPPQGTYNLTLMGGGASGDTPLSAILDPTVSRDIKRGLLQIELTKEERDFLKLILQKPAAKKAVAPKAEKPPIGKRVSKKSSKKASKAKSAEAPDPHGRPPHAPPTKTPGMPNLGQDLSQPQASPTSASPQLGAAPVSGLNRPPDDQLNLAALQKQNAEQPKPSLTENNTKGLGGGLV